MSHVQRLLRIVAIAAVALTIVGCETSSGSPGPSAPDGSAAPGASDSPDPGSTVQATYNPVDDDGRSFAIEEVVFGEEGFVRIRNFTSVPARLGGLYLCDPPDCVALPDVEVPPDTSALLAFGSGSGLEGVVVPDVDLALEPAAGEVGLYGSDKTDVANDIRDYVEWGSTPHEGTATAIEAGIWLEGSYAPSIATAKRIYRAESAGWVFE